MSLKLWGGRFTKETDKLVNDFNASISFDKRMYAQDITGSIAHAAMLGKQGIIDKESSDKIVNELKKIKNEIDSGSLEITEEYEDIHSFVEATLISRIGDTGKKLHTGRSRNDQVALDMKLHIRNEIIRLDERLYDLEKALFINPTDACLLYRNGTRYCCSLVLSQVLDKLHRLQPCRVLESATTNRGTWKRME